MEKVDLKLGEKRLICISVRSCNRKAFEVVGAKYALRCGDVVEISGDCEIERRSDSETVLSAIIEPLRKNAIYKLEYKYQIPPEVLIHEIKIDVS